MAINPTETDLYLIQMNSRNIRIRIDVLNFNFETISSLEGRTTSGNISIDANSDIRRTCNVTLVVEKASSIISPRW